MAGKGSGKGEGNSLFQPLKEGLSLSKPSERSIRLEHLSHSPVTMAKRKRSRDSTDELPDYIEDDQDDNVSLPVTKRSPISKQSPSISSRSNTAPAATNPNIKPGTVSPTNSARSMSQPLFTTAVSPPSKSVVTRVSPIKATSQVKKRASDKSSAIQSKRKLISKPTMEKEGTQPKSNLGSTIATSPNKPLFASDNPFKSMGKMTKFPNTPVKESSTATFSFTAAASASATKQDSKSLPKSTKGATPVIPIKRQQITEGISVRPLFVMRLMKDPEELKMIGGDCIDISPDKQRIIVTGEKHQVKVIIDRLEKKIQSFISALKSKAFVMKAVFAPLLLEESFTKKLEDICQDNLVEIRFVKLGSTEPVTCETVVSELKAAIGDDKNLTLHHLYKANLLQQRESLKQQWYIQNRNGIWDKVPFGTNDLFNKSSLTTLEVKDKGQTFKVNLETKQAVGPDGFRYPMKSEDMKPTWLYYQDDDFGFVSYSDEVSSLIENCYKTHKVEPVSVLIDDDNCECYFNFQSKLEWNLAKKSNRHIKRDPPIMPPFLSPKIHLILTGYQPDIDSAEKSLDSFIQEKLKSSPLPPRINQQLLECRLAQYCVEMDCHKVTGVNQYADKVLFEEAVNLINFISEEEVPPDWAPQENDVEVFPVDKGTEEWHFVQSKWNKTMSVPLKRIDRIQNKWLWRHYCLCRERIKSKNRGMENEKWLFHGTRETKPEEVYNSEKGCDFRFSSSGMWGNGSYFADKAFYSNDYRHQSSLGKQMFLVRVLTGDAVELPPQKLKMPPLKNPTTDKTVRYDSVKGFTKNTNIYIVYEHDKSYPAYLITY